MGHYTKGTESLNLS